MIRQRNGHPGGCDGVGSPRLQPMTPRNTTKGIMPTTLRARKKICSNRRSCQVQHAKSGISNPRNDLDGYHPRIPGEVKRTPPSKYMMPFYQSRHIRPAAQTFAERGAFAAFLVLVASAVVHSVQAADATTDYLKPSVSSKVNTFYSLTRSNSQGDSCL